MSNHLTCDSSLVACWPGSHALIIGHDTVAYRFELCHQTDIEG